MGLREVVLVGCVAGCGQGGMGADRTHPCNPEAEQCLLSHNMGGTTLQPGQEDDNVCLSWTLDNESELFVHSVDVVNGGAFHHSNWFFVPDTSFRLPDGQPWPCRESGFDELAAAIQGGVLYAQSTQATAEKQQFGDGVAIRVPRYSRVIAWNHFLNASDRVVDTSVDVTLETLPQAEVSVELTPFRFNYSDIHLPPQRASRISGACDIRTEVEALGQPWQFRLHYVLPHYHKFGRRFVIETTGEEPEVLFDVENAFGEPLGKTFDPPLDIAAIGSDGLRFTCAYQNPLAREVVYGIGEDEMCVMLGFAESPVRFDAQVTLTSSFRDAADGSRAMAGDCDVTGIRSE